MVNHLLSPSASHASSTLEQEAGPLSPENCTDIRKDDLYYLENVVFKVDDTLFCVPKNCLNIKGTPFPDMFRNAAKYFDDKGDTATEGSSDAFPIVLQKTSKESFKGFLRAMYRFGSAESALTYHELVGALNLSTKWNFLKLRKRVIRELSPFMDARPTRDRIVLATVCKIDHWLLDAFTSLVLQPAPLDLTEIASYKGIDSVTIAKLSLLHEQRQIQAASEGGHPGQFCECDRCAVDFALVRRQAAVEQVKQMFASELDEVSMK